MAVICRSKVTSCSFHNEIHHVDFFKNNNKSVLIKSAQHTSGLENCVEKFYTFNKQKNGGDCEGRYAETLMREKR